MSLTTTVQDWMRDVGDRENSAVIARAHVAAETSTDVDRICATISHDVYFGVPVRTRDGNELRSGSVLTTYDQVRGYYEGRAGSYVVLESAQLKSISTEWYLFNETAATLRGTGMVNGIDASGKEWIVNSAVIFPTAPDGIRGEICITRYPMDDIVAETVRVPAPASGRQTWMPLGEMQLGSLLDRFILAVRDGQWDQVAADLSDRHALAVRLDDVKGAQQVPTATDRAGALQALQGLFDSAADLTLLNRIASEWYVFAEYLVRLANGGRRRLALVHPVEDGKLTGTFGYGRDEQD
ncbi:MAG TPA: hypothetical protein VGH66_14525 [Acidimicrobiales bacterium]